MPERMMITCPGCDGVVSVSPTGDEAEVRCLKCDEMVYARNAEGGEWWANVPVADPTVEKPAAVPVAAERVEVPAELPDVVQDSVSTPQTESSKAPKDTSPPSATDWILGAVIASIFALLWFGLVYVLFEEIAPGIVPAIGKDLAAEFAAYSTFGVFLFCVFFASHWVRTRRSGSDASVDLAKDTEKKSDWLSKLPGVDHEGLAALRAARRDRETPNEEQAASETTPPDEESGPADEESGPPVSSEANEAGNSFFPKTEDGQTAVVLLVLFLIVLAGWLFVSIRMHN